MLGTSLTGGCCIGLAARLDKDLRSGVMARALDIARVLYTPSDAVEPSEQGTEPIR